VSLLASVSRAMRSSMRRLGESGFTFFTVWRCERIGDPKGSPTSDNPA
jgi:hypothetical protein